MDNDFKSFGIAPGCKKFPFYRCIIHDGSILDGHSFDFLIPVDSGRLSSLVEDCLRSAKSVTILEKEFHELNYIDGKYKL